MSVPLYFIEIWLFDLTLYPLNVGSDDIKKKLIAGGIPENEIAYIHSTNTEKQKSELFDVSGKYSAYGNEI